MKAYKPVGYALVFYFLFPYLLFLKFANLNFQIDMAEVIWAFKNSVLQSALAATLVTVLSLPMSWGLFGLSPRLSGLAQKLLLLPQVLPSFFSILIAFTILKPFPIGTGGIAFIFVMVHLGFAVVLLHSATTRKLGSYAMVAEVFGLSRLSFLRRVYFPLLKNDFLVSFLLVFTFCFSSFAVPLIAGGGRDTNVEVLIYEKIFINQNWSAAWAISALQTVFLTALSFFLIRRQPLAGNEFYPASSLKSTIGMGLILFYLGSYSAGYLTGLGQSAAEIPKFALVYDDLLGAVWNSLRLFLIYALLSGVLLYAWLYVFTKQLRLGLFSHLIAASTMLVGFSFYIYFPQSAAWDHFKVPMASSILVFPVLFKSFLEKPLLDLKDQIVTAKVFGLSPFRIVMDVLVRRLSAPLATWFGFLSIWFLCDFATLKALGTQTQTLSLLAQNFLSSYRLGLAYLLSVFILFVWFILLALAYFLKGGAGVVYKKFKFRF